ncbi:PKD domain-containing protein [Methanofollis fontis]|uniref:PKD domain-containing protein n=1 Tax=Methanofollis fontis TaxID=2052832 RepID=A0A483CL17_9EURY|nr:PKD domain-containing protein [Methanofollis fontis]TAJ43450.1 hypothetical protein CUJ86_10670 [Methanofollis fontis]
MKPFTICILILLSVLSVPAGALFEPGSGPAFQTDKENLTASEGKLSSDLLGIARSTVSGAPLLSGAPETDDGGSVYVYVGLDAAASTHVIDPYADEVTDRDEEHHLAAAHVSADDLLDLASVPSVLWVRQVLPPSVRTGSTVTEGDTLLRAAALREATGYGGAGMRIGVISDGVDHIDDAVASGDLPSDVQVLSNTCGGDEGTAMLEIVHDIAPDADLCFHDCGNNWIAFNNAIEALAAAGCTVICDDIGWLQVPYFEDGIIASHIQSLVDDGGLIYVSSAGNDADCHYQALFSDDGEGRHEFGEKGVLPFTVSPGRTVYLILQWNDPWGASGNDYDLVVYDANGVQVASSTGPQDGNDNPIEEVRITNTGTTTATYYAAVQKYSGSARTLEIYAFGGMIPPDDRTVEDSVYGHSAAEGVIAAGSIDHRDGIRYYSSRGPATISYPAATERGKPQVVATDGVQVTGAGGFSNPFYGTSAAAPHVAAVCGLVWGLVPERSADEMRGLLLSTAADLGTGGFDNTFGAGRVDAFALYNASGFPPNASFTASPLSGEAPLTVAFNDTSTGTPTAWSWAFGDNETSTEQHPLHTYAMPGTYTVSLTASNAFGNDTMTESEYIAVTAPPLEANFSANSTAGTAPFTVSFTDTSVGTPTAWSWAFGDNATSTEQHPLHTYLMPGAFTVNLTVTDSFGSTSTKTAERYIDVDFPLLFAGIRVNLTSGFAPLAVQFDDASTGSPTAWFWEFGDTTTSTEQNPVHIFTAGGTYLVNLTVTDSFGTENRTTTTITAITPLHPAFTANRTVGVVPFGVGFTDLTPEGASAWSWAFGDNATSAEQHPAHTYTVAGTYTVSLTVDNGAGTVTKEGYIDALPLLFGDANEDGAVNQADTLRVLKQVVGLSALPEAESEGFRKSDVHENGVIEVGDALYIAQHNVGLRDVWFRALAA